VADTGIDGPYTAWAFGDSEAMATDLALLVRDGPKRAPTRSQAWGGNRSRLPITTVYEDGQTLRMILPWAWPSPR
jgi:uncharacterized protein YhfF